MRQRGTTVVRLVPNQRTDRLVRRIGRHTALERFFRCFPCNCAMCRSAKHPMVHSLETVQPIRKTADLDPVDIERLLPVIHHHPIGLDAAVGADDDGAVALAFRGVDTLGDIHLHGKTAGKVVSPLAPR